MTPEAKRVIAYLEAKQFNTAEETASDCGMDEAGLDAALDEIEENTDYFVAMGMRDDSYGREVIWLTDLSGRPTEKKLRLEGAQPN